MRAREIFWHDCVVRKIVELPESDMLVFEVDYPVDWENQKFEPRSIVFSDVFTYEIHEGAVWGALTLLDASETNIESENVRSIRIETTAGYRVIRCKSLTLEMGTATASNTS